MAERDERHGNLGRTARRGDLKSWTQLVAIAITLAAVIWRGGEMTEKLDSVVKKVDQVSQQVSNGQIDAAALRARVEGHDKELANHETRITRLENRDRR